MLRAASLSVVVNMFLATTCLLRLLAPEYSSAQLLDEIFRLESLLLTTYTYDLVSGHGH